MKESKKSEPLENQDSAHDYTPKVSNEMWKEACELLKLLV